MRPATNHISTDIKKKGHGYVTDYSLIVLNTNFYILIYITRKLFLSLHFIYTEN